MAFTYSQNYTQYVALGLAADEVLNRFYRAIPVGPGDGNTIAVNIFSGGSISVPDCNAFLSDTGDTSHVSLTAYEKVFGKCFDLGDYRSFEYSAASRLALADHSYRELSDGVKGIFVADMVAQYIGAGFTNTWTLAATNGNFVGATTALAADSIQKLGAAVTHVMNESGGNVDSMAIIFPINSTVNNLVNFSTQVTAYAGNSSGFMGQDGYLRFMNVKCYTISDTDAGWGGSGTPSSGDNQIAAVVLSNVTPGYAISPIGRDGYVTSGKFEDALVMKGPDYDGSTGKYRLNFHLSLAAGIANETAIAIVDNP